MQENKKTSHKKKKNSKRGKKGWVAKLAGGEKGKGITSGKVENFPSNSRRNRRSLPSSVEQTQPEVTETKERGYVFLS